MLIRLTHVAYETIKETGGPKGQGTMLRLTWGYWIRGKLLLSCACLWGCSMERGMRQWLEQSGLQCTARWRDCLRSFALSRRLVHRTGLVPVSIQSNLFPQHSITVKISWLEVGAFFRDVYTWTFTVCNVSASTKLIIIAKPQTIQM